MMATVPHVTSGLGLRKFQADGSLLTGVYISYMNTDGQSALFCEAIFFSGTSVALRETSIIPSSAICRPIR